MLKTTQGEAVEICCSWIPVSDGSIPARAVSAGGNVYVARAYHEGEYLPGKVADGHTSAYVPYGGAEVSKNEYEVLVDSCLNHLPGEGYEWVHASNGSVPKRALVAGTNSGKPLYIGRAEINGEMTVGKVFPEHNCGYMPWGGEEHTVHSYEVLCCTKRSI